MFASASQSSVDQMFQGLRDRQKIATGGSIGVTRPQDKRTSIRVGAPFDPFMNGVPMSAIPPGHPAAQIADGGPYIPPGHPAGMLLGGGNDTGGLPTDDPADRPPRQRIDARPKAARMMGGPSLPFGGFRARGGPVRPGKAYVVGEQGPELFVPGASGSIVPNAGMSLAAPPMITGAPPGGMIPQVAGIRTAAQHGQSLGEYNQWMKDLVPKGSTNYPRVPFGRPAGPPPPVTGAPPMITGAPPMITGAPPMITGAPPMSGGGSLSDRATMTDGARRTGSLSDRKAVPVGRGMSPERRLQMFARRAWTRGDEKTAADIAAQQQQQKSYQDFARERDAVNFNQGLFMHGMSQQAHAAQTEQQRQERFAMWNAEQAAQSARDAQQWQNQQTLHEMGVNEQTARDARLRDQALQDEQRSREFGLQPVRVAGTTTPYFQNAKGSIFTGSPIPTAPDPAMIKRMESMGMKPSGANSQGDMQFAPAKPSKAETPTGIQYEKDAGGKITGGVYPVLDEQTGTWRLQRLDFNGDGKVSKDEAAAAQAAAVSGGKSGFTWKSLVQPKL